VNGTPAEVTSYVLDAAAIYDKVVPPSQDWPEYSVEDE
jgi:hypothetical protein